ncbi:MAG: lipopolysaccharide heptosyltransferase II [Chloroflexota bacterium]
MDRDSLVRRNLQLAEAFHQPPVQHRLRRYIIDAVAKFPFRALTKGWNRVLFIKPDHLGDMLLAIPAMKALKEARPYTEIHVLAGSWAAGVLVNVPEVDMVLTIDFPGFVRGEEKTNYLEPYTQLYKVSRQLRQIGYGHAIVMRPDHWWGAMLAYVAGISERIGYDVENVSQFLTQALPYQHDHVIRQNLRLVEQWTDTIADEDVLYNLAVYEDEREAIQSQLMQFGFEAEQRYFCIHPGSGTWVKRWENDLWAKVADTLIDQLDAEVIFTGTDGERAIVEDIQNRMTHTSYTTAGDLNLEQLAALYERALVVVGPDSGPLHLSAAVDTPTVALFGPADPVEFAPWGAKDRHIIVTSPIGCRPCRVLDWGDDDPDYHPCVRHITIGQVLEAARTVVNQL